MTAGLTTSLSRCRVAESAVEIGATPGTEWLEGTMEATSLINTVKVHQLNQISWDGSSTPQALLGNDENIIFLTFLDEYSDLSKIAYSNRHLFRC